MMLKILEYVDTHPYIWKIIYLIIAIFGIVLIIQFIKGGTIKLFGVEFNINKRDMKNNLSEFIQTLPSRSQSMNYIRDNVENAKSSVDFVFVTGGFIPSVFVESLLKNKSDIDFHIYLVHPLSASRSKRTEDTKEIFAVGKKGDGYKHIIDACKKYKNGHIYFYEDYPYWHYIQIDNNRIVVSYNPLGRVGFETSPVFILENKEPTDRLFAMFSEHIRVMKKYAKPVNLDEINEID
jgi:hypothetical protein